MNELITKLNEFYSSITNIKSALTAKTGGVISLESISEIPQIIANIKTSRSMGTKSVTFEQNAIVYGIKIDESESDPEKRVIYTDDAKGMVPVASYGTDYGTWKPSWIFEKIFPVMLKSDGTIDYLLDPDNQTLKKDGGSSDISNINYDGNAMVNFDKFYISFGMDGEDEVIRICNVQTTISGTASFDPIGFYRNNKSSEADRIFLPMFVGVEDSKGRLRSISEQSIKNVEKYSTAVASAEKNGSGYGIESYAMNQMLGVLYLILMKNCNVMTTLGYGRSLYESGVIVKTGYQTTRGAISSGKFLWVEDFINGLDTSHFAVGFKKLESGFNYPNGYVYIKMYPPYYTPGKTTGYTNVQDYKFSTVNLIKQMKCSNSYGRIPVYYTDSGVNYECCRTVYTMYPTSSSTRGGENAVFGRSLSDFESGTTTMDTSLCAALTYLPPK